MADILTCELKTLTPLWTGGADGTSDRLHATGIIGSLRWWYEGLLRGMGAHVCNATADNPDERCLFEQKEGESREEALARICPACQLFGCTGWRRRFCLDVTGLEPHDLFFAASKGVYVAAGNWLWRMFGGEELGGRKEGRGAAVRFDFGVQALWGEKVTLSIIPLDDHAEDTLARMAFLLDFVVRWGAIGAKPQHGFGQIEIIEGPNYAQIEKGHQLLISDAKLDQNGAESGYFTIASFFSHIYQLHSPNHYFDQLRMIGSPPRGFPYRGHYVPVAFDIRYKSRSRDFRTGEGEDFGLRPWFRKRWGKEVAHQLFGRSDARQDDDRSAGRIYTSHPFRLRPDGPWMLKIWGHVPAGLRSERSERIPVQTVENQVTAFVKEMFPGSQLQQRFNPEEVIHS